MGNPPARRAACIMTENEMCEEKLLALLFVLLFFLLFVIDENLELKRHLGSIEVEHEWCMAAQRAAEGKPARCDTGNIRLGDPVTVVEDEETRALTILYQGE